MLVWSLVYSFLAAQWLLHPHPTHRCVYITGAQSGNGPKTIL